MNSKNRKSFFLTTVFIALLCCAGTSEGAAPPAKPKPAPGAPGIPILSWEDYHKDMPYIFLDDIRKSQLNDDWTVDEYAHYRIKIQKESAKHLGEQEIYYNRSREEILDIKAHVETPDGKTFPSTEIQDLAVYEGEPMYSDSRVKVITLPQVNVGSIIDVEVKSRIVHSIIKEQFFDEEIYPHEPHKHYKAVYVFPKNKHIAFKAFHAVVPPQKTEENDKTIYTFEYNETVALENTEIFLPPYTEIFGLFTFSSMPDWQMIADWYRGLVKKNIIDDPEIVQKAKELISGKTTQKEKARAVLEFLQDNMRYVSMSFGDNTVEPHPTNEIFRNRYGDCKDWSLLAKQMLALAGIRADITLFIDEMGGDPQWGLPRVSAFNHAILEVFVDDEHYFVDPQLKHYDFSQYPQLYNHAHVFVIDDKAGRFDQIPDSSMKEATHEIKVRVALNGSGEAVYDVKTVLGIDVSNQLRQLWETLGPDGKDKFFEVIQSQFARGGRMFDTQLDKVEQRYNPVEMKFKIQSPNAYQAVNQMLILQEPIRQYITNPFVEQSRTYPLFVADNSSVRIVGVYKVPPHYAVDYIPKNFSLKHELIELSRKTVYKDGRLYVRYIFTTKRGRLPVERYGEIIKLWDEFYKQVGESIILKKE